MGLPPRLSALGHNIDVPWFQNYVAGSGALGDVPSLLPRREVTRRLGLLGVGAAATTALIHSSGTSNASAADNSIDVSDYLDASEPSSHSAGFQSAIDAAIALGGTDVFVPSGDWQVEGLVIPAQKPIRIRGPVSDNFPNNEQVNGFSSGARLQRVGNAPIFSLIGSGSDLPESGVGGSTGDYLNWEGYCRNFVLEDISLRSANTDATAPLILAKGCGALHFSRVVFFAGSGLSLLDMQATQDTRFDDCFFLGGGESSTGLPALFLRSGDPLGTKNGYTACNSCVFVNCSSENYSGPGIGIGDSEVDTPFRANLICFVNHKMDSVACTTPHIVVGRGNGIFMSNGWISHSNNAGPVVDLQNCLGFYGDLAFNHAQVPPATVPSALVAVSAECSLVDFDVRVLPSIMNSDDNVVTQANTDDPTVEIRVNGYSQRTNGKAATRWVTAASVMQRSYTENSTCQYVFAKDGHYQWGIGNPSSPDGDVQQMEVRVSDFQGNTGTAVIIRSTGADATTSRKELRIPGGGLVADFAEVGGNPVGVRVGVPASSTDPGEAGMWAADNNWLYVVTATDSWQRVALSNW